MRKMIVIGTSVLLFAGLGLASAKAAPVIPKDYTQDLIKTNEDLVEVLRKNVSFCQRAVVQVKAFHKKNIKEFKRKKEATKKYMKRLSPAQQKATLKRLTKQIMQLYGEMMQVSSQYQKKCPKHGKKMTKAFQEFSLK